METSTADIWVERVAAWRASGEPAETFSRRGGYAANTLRCWASKLKRSMATAATSPSLQLARVVRSAAVESAEARNRAVVVELVDGGVRIVVESGSDPSTLAMVLEVVRGSRR